MNINVIHIADEPQSNYSRNRDQHFDDRIRVRSEYNKMYYKLHSEKLKQRNALNNKKRRDDLIQRLSDHDLLKKKFSTLLNDVKSTFGTYENFQMFRRTYKKYDLWG